MRGLLVGATGILGSNLMALSEKADWTPTYLDPLVHSSNAIGLDLRNRSAVLDLVRSLQPQVIVHVAGITKPDVCETNPDLSYQVNVIGSGHLITAAKLFDIRLIFLSSDLVFDGTKGQPYTEEDPVNPQTVYGAHKVQVEEMIRRELNNYLVIRTGVMYGWTPRIQSSIAEWILEKLASGVAVEMFADQYRCMTFVGDMAHFIDGTLGKDATGTIHFSSPDCVSKSEFARELARVFGYDTNLIRDVSYRTFTRAAPVPGRLGLDISKVIRDWGANPEDLHRGIAAMHQQIETGFSMRLDKWFT